LLIWKRMVVHVEKLEPSSNPLPLSHHHPARSSADLCGEKNSFPTSKGGRPKTWHRNCYNLCTMCMYIYIYICVYTAYNIIHNIICNMFKINNRYLYIYTYTSTYVYTVYNNITTGHRIKIISHSKISKLPQGPKRRIPFSYFLRAWLRSGEPSWRNPEVFEANFKKRWISATKSIEIPRHRHVVIHLWMGHASMGILVVIYIYIFIYSIYIYISNIIQLCQHYLGLKERAPGSLPFLLFVIYIYNSLHKEK
jgi:hypothetical protein